jgi:hypothetical protein
LLQIWPFPVLQQVLPIAQSRLFVQFTPPIEVPWHTLATHEWDLHQLSEVHLPPLSSSAVLQVPASQ